MKNKSEIPIYITLKQLNKLNNVKTEQMQIKKQKILAIENVVLPL